MTSSVQEHGGAPSMPSAHHRPRARRTHGGRVLVAERTTDQQWSRRGERLEDLWAEICRLRPHALAVDGATPLTYAELDEQANQLVGLLAGYGLAAGDRVGLLFSEPERVYPAMLATLKLGAAYVPLDPAFPIERLAYIASDAGLAAVLTESGLEPNLREVDSQVRRLCLDTLPEAVASRDASPPDFAPREAAGLCYVIYTSGTTGRPKGVAIAHPSICNFVRVASACYGVRDDDRVYQGLTIAFDFAVEEIWVAWMVGATIVPRPGASNLVGDDLRDFLRASRVTALCCVPTLLSTLPEDLPDLRFVLVSGESCPPDLVARWHRPGRRLLNVYGPTETTVSATWTVLSPDRPVTIGVPLPSYAVVILDPAADRALESGQEGEIAIAGIGLAEGYLNQPERTSRAFIRDFLDLECNPSGRLYRTGDLGRIADDEVEHLGRIDTQVKIRGYRIETEEIEAVLRELPDVAQAAVTTHASATGDSELVAYVVPVGAGIDRCELVAHLRGRLPPYMIPAYLEELPVLPLMPSGKLDRHRLPGTTSRLVEARAHVEAANPVEAELAGSLASVLGLERVSVEADLFDALGASSLLLARWTAELRRRGEIPPVAIRDIYRSRTVRSLAHALAHSDDSEVEMFTSPELPEPQGTPHYVLCGALQLVVFLAYATAVGAAFDAISGWITTGGTVWALLARALVCGAGTLTAVAILPVPIKWLLVGRFKPQRIRVWSIAYVRFWVVKTLIVANPLVRLLAGTALYSLYLRALGARIESGSVILTEHIPVAADLVRIGAGAVIRKDAFLNGYRARDGVIEIGPVSIGAGAFVGEQTVLDIHTTVGDGAQLGHGSGLLSGQSIPAGACWHGSPARPAEPGCSYQTVPDLRGATSARRGRDAVLRLLFALFLLGPMEAIAGSFLLAHPRALESLPTAATPLVAAAVVLGAVLLAGLISGIAPRVLSRALEPGRVYPLPGRHFALQRTLARASNIPGLVSLLGDSSAITSYLRWLGYRLGRVEQSGSNFGTALKHEVPTLCHVGSGTMVSDGLSMQNFECSSSAFRVMPVRIAERNYLGNAVGWPADARVGENCLIATKALLPITGEMRRNVGLLGSPAFEIPRHPEPHPELAAYSREPERSRRLAAKNRHNAVTMLLSLLVRITFLTALLVTARAWDGLHGWSGLGVSTAQIALDTLVIPIVLFVPAERATTGFRALQPRVCSMLQPGFWSHERFWKVPALAYQRVFDGTPFKGLLWRALGVRVAGRVFDDGAGISERSMVELGPDVTLNMGARIQGHSLEDGIFKSDRIAVGARATVGTGAVVHYGVTIGAGAVLEADSFLMKGSVPADHTCWRGNPAMEVLNPNRKVR